jgi:SAM-dependent methyltransferase
MSKSVADRAERERETYNAGLDDRYRSFLMESMHQFEQWRIAKGAAIIKASASQHVLEIGSYAWHKYVERGGCDVPGLICINISEQEMAKGKALAENSRNRPDFRLMDAHSLDFPENSFDVVFGSAILHHSGMERALPEIARVLKPGASMFFHEPMDLNPVARIVRMLTPKSRTDDERPFRLRDLALIHAHFDVEMTFTEFLTVPLGALCTALGISGDSVMMRAAFIADQAIGKIPGVRPWSRHVFIVGRAKPR